MHIRVVRVSGMRNYGEQSERCRAARPAEGVMRGEKPLMSLFAFSSARLQKSFPYLLFRRADLKGFSDGKTSEAIFLCLLSFSLPLKTQNQKSKRGGFANLSSTSPPQRAYPPISAKGFSSEEGRRQGDSKKAMPCASSFRADEAYGLPQRKRRPAFIGG